MTLPELEAGRTYFITAEKLITTSEGIEVTDISAAYSNVTVVPSNEQSGNYINKIHLAIEKADAKKEFECSPLDETASLWLPAELHDGKFYAKLELTDNVPEDTVAYAVYSDPQNGSIYRL